MSRTHILDRGLTAEDVSFTLTPVGADRIRDAVNDAPAAWLAHYAHAATDSVVLVAWLCRLAEDTADELAAARFDEIWKKEFPNVSPRRADCIDRMLEAVRVTLGDDAHQIELTAEDFRFAIL